MYYSLLITCVKEKYASIPETHGLITERVRFFIRFPASSRFDSIWFGFVWSVCSVRFHPMIYSPDAIKILCTINSFIARTVNDNHFRSLILQICSTKENVTFCYTYTCTQNTPKTLITLTSKQIITHKYTNRKTTSALSVDRMKQSD